MERYYFYTRAKNHGLPAPDTSGVVEEIRLFDLENPYPQYDLLPKLKTLQQFLERGDLDAARKMAFDLTYFSCGRGMAE